MDETPAAFGIPDWLPPGARRSVAMAEQAAERENRAAEREREERREQRRAATVEAVRAAAELRGESLSPIDLASGNIPGRPLAAIFGEAQAQADRADAKEAARRRREGEPAPVHITFDEPNIATVSTTKRSILSRSRKWQAWQTARQNERNARAAVAAELDWGMVGDLERKP